MRTKHSTGSQWNQMAVGLVTVSTLIAVATTASTFIATADLTGGASTLVGLKTATSLRLFFYFLTLVSITSYLCALALGLLVPFQTTAEAKRNKASTLARCVAVQGASISVVIIGALAMQLRSTAVEYLDLW